MFKRVPLNPLDPNIATSPSQFRMNSKVKGGKPASLKEAGYEETGKIIGEGGMGLVSLVECAGKLFVCKESSTSDQRHIQKEWYALSRVSGIRGIPKLIDYVKLADGTCFLIMEFIQNAVDLPTFHRLHGFMTWDEQRYFASRLLEILQEAHARGIVHRDLKGENVLVQEKNGLLEPILIDWGLACAIGKSTDPCGTRYAMPPEMILSDAKPFSQSDESVDVWGFGVVLYELLFGQDPFHLYDNYDELDDAIVDCVWDDRGQTNNNSSYMMDEQTYDFFDGIFQLQEERVKFEYIKFHLDSYFQEEKSGIILDWNDDDVPPGLNMV